MSRVRELGLRAKAASRRLAGLDRARKDSALRAIADRLRGSQEAIAAANTQDVEQARASGLSSALIDRLGLGPLRLESTAGGVEEIAALPDPVGSQREMHRLANGLLAGRQRVPLGVVAMIYESRPNVTVDAAALCLKSGNSVMLRGGKEAQATNAVLGKIIGEALESVELPADAVVIVPADTRETTKELLQLHDVVDMAIPRGGYGLIRFVAENARVPVVKHYHGVCHLYLDEGCDPQMALRLTVNGKVQRPGVCNALECLLVHRQAAAAVLPSIGAALAEAGVEVRGCDEARRHLPAAVAATDDDWGREFLDLKLAIRVVDDMDAAMDHVARYGSLHTEVICTRSYERGQRWVREVDASCVMINASTRFNDGGQLGLGAEIGISTSKLHAYGPMGLESLTTEKWVVFGEGQVRS